MTLLPTLLVLSSVTLRRSKACDLPPTPLAAAFRPHYGEGMRVIGGEFSCQEGFVGVGSPALSCQEGSWSPADFLCTSNVALQKPSFYNSNTSLPGSSLAVDGLSLTNKSSDHCDRLDSQHRVLTVDLRERLSVAAVQIFTHDSGTPVDSVEIRVGDDVDHSENRMCWYVPSLQQGAHQTFRCPEVVAGRYVSLSVHSPESPLYLCELLVLSDAREVVSHVQCGANQVHANTCVRIQQSKKMSFLSSVEMCRDHNMSLIHNHTQQAGRTYSMVKDFFQEISRTTKQRMLVWENTSWHWLHGPEVQVTDWGTYEPGQTGSCVVMDSQIRWAWNAIRCVISAYVGCQGPPQWCPSPEIRPGVTFKLADTRETQYKNGVSLQMTCKKGYVGAPSESAVTRCEGGLWTSYSLSCSPHDCGPFPLPSPSLSLTYPDNTTSYGSLAILSCSEGDIYRQSSLICRKDGWRGETPNCTLTVSQAKLEEEDLLYGDTEEETEEEISEREVVNNLGPTNFDKNLCPKNIIFAILIVRALK